MEQRMLLEDAVSRISRMERCFDALQSAAIENPAAFRENASIEMLLRNLTQYYESGQWLRDYELDEQGLLPQDLKRGVLSQDAVYDFLNQIKRETD